MVTPLRPCKTSRQQTALYTAAVTEPDTIWHGDARDACLSGRRAKHVQGFMWEPITRLTSSASWGGGAVICTGVHSQRCRGGLRNHLMKADVVCVVLSHKRPQSASPRKVEAQKHSEQGRHHLCGVYSQVATVSVAQEAVPKGFWSFCKFKSPGGMPAATRAESSALAMAGGVYWCGSSPAHIWVAPTEVISKHCT